MGEVACGSFGNCDVMWSWGAEIVAHLVDNLVGKTGLILTNNI